LKYFSLTNFFYFFFYSFIFFFLFFLEWTKDRIKKHVAAIRAGGGYYKGMPEEDAVKMGKASGGHYKGMPEEDAVKMGKASGGYYKGMPEEDAVEMGKASGASYKGMPEEDAVKMAKASGGSYKGMPEEDAVEMGKASGGYYKGMPEEDAVKMAKASGGSYKGMPEIEKMRNAMSFGTGPRVQEALELIQGKSTLRVKKKGTKAYPAIDCEVSVEYEPRIEGYVMVVDKTGFVSVKGLCRHLWEKSGRSPNHSDSYKFVYLKKNDKLFQEKLQDGSWNFN